MATLAERIVQASNRAEGARIHAESAHNDLRTGEAEQQADIARRSFDVTRRILGHVAESGKASRRDVSIAEAAAERAEAAAYAAGLLRRLAHAEANVHCAVVAGHRVADAAADAYENGAAAIEIVEAARAAADEV